MAFGKLFKKKASDDELDDDELLGWSSSFDEETEADEDEIMDTPQLAPRSLADPAPDAGAGSDEGDSQGSGKNLQEESSRGEGPDQEASSGDDRLLDVFQEETEIDQHLETLASLVEEVMAEELVEEIQSLMGELQRL